MIKKWLTLGFLFGIGLWMSLPNFAQQKKNLPNPEISEELRIMKGVLKEMLFSDKQQGLFSSHSIEGIYLPDYGLVFDVKASGTQMMETMKAQLELLNSQQKAIQESIEAMPAVIKEAEDALPSVLREFNKEAKLDSFKQLLNERKQAFSSYLQAMEKASQAHRAAARAAALEKMNAALEKNKRSVQQFLKNYAKATTAKNMRSFREFLENYADAGDLLAPDQRITIYYDWHATPDSNSISMPAFFSVKKADILRFRSGKITEGQFWKRVQKGTKPSPEVQKQLEIMKRILKTGLKFRSNSPWPMGEAEAHFLPGYGCWFALSDARLGVSFSLPFVVPEKLAKKDEEARKQKAVQDYYSHVIRLIGQYGSGLRFLKPRQWVVVTFHTPFFSDGLNEKIFLLRVKKEDIETLRQRKIHWRAFQNRVELYEF